MTTYITEDNLSSYLEKFLVIDKTHHTTDGKITKVKESLQIRPYRNATYGYDVDTKHTVVNHDNDIKETNNG